jgi:hypothetical protein
MTRFDRKTIWATTILGVTLLQLGSAGAVWFGHQAAKQALALEQKSATALQQQVAAQRERQAASPTVTPSQSRWCLLDGPDVAATMEILNALGVEASLTFDVIKASTSNVVGKQSFQLAGHGTPQQVCAFLAAIEKHERLIVVESGRMQPGIAAEVAFDLGLATYHRGGGR